MNSLPHGWQWKRLGDLCKSAKTTEPRRNPDSPFRYVDISSVDNIRKSIIGARTILGKDAPSRARQLIRTNDVLIATTRPNLNAVALVPSELDKEICSTGFCVLRPTEQINPLLLFLFTQSPLFIETLTGYTRGGLYPAVSDDQVRDVMMPYPPLERQTTLTAKLNSQIIAAARVRAAAERQQEAVRVMTGVLLREMFELAEAGQYEPKRLGDVCEIQLGKMLSSVYQTGMRPRPYLRNANVQWGRFDLSDVYQMDFTEREEEKLALKDGDLLVCEGGEPGRAAVWNGQIEPCYYQKALHRLRPINEAIDPYFIMYRLWKGALEDEFLDSQTKSTIAHLPAERLADLQIKLPSLNEQRKFVQRISEQMTKIEVVKTAADRGMEALNALPNAILREVFGESVSPELNS